MTFAPVTITLRDDGLYGASRPNTNRSGYECVAAADPANALRCILGERPYVAARSGAYELINSGTRFELHVNGMCLTAGSYDDVLTIYKGLTK